MNEFDEFLFKNKKKSINFNKISKIITLFKQNNL